MLLWVLMVIWENSEVCSLDGSWMKSHKPGYGYFFIATLSWCIFFIISRHAVKNAPSVTRSHDSQLFCATALLQLRVAVQTVGLSPPHEVKCTMEMWLLATSVYPSFEFSSIFLLSMCMLIAPHASSKTEGNRGLSCSVQLQQAWE